MLAALWANHKHYKCQFRGGSDDIFGRQRTSLNNRKRLPKYCFQKYSCVLGSRLSGDSQTVIWNSTQRDNAKRNQKIVINTAHSNWLLTEHIHCKIVAQNDRSTSHNSAHAQLKKSPNLQNVASHNIRFDYSITNKQCSMQSSLIKLAWKNTAKIFSQSQSKKKNQQV